MTLGWNGKKAAFPKNDQMEYKQEGIKPML
jgi:hypothetical protein